LWFPEQYGCVSVTELRCRFGLGWAERRFEALEQFLRGVNREHRNGLLFSHGEAQASPGKFDFVNGHYAKVIDGGGDLTSVATCDSGV
jgi:hypothetical protein